MMSIQLLSAQKTFLTEDWSDVAVVDGYKLPDRQYWLRAPTPVLPFLAVAYVKD